MDTYNQDFFSLAYSNSIPPGTNSNRLLMLEIFLMNDVTHYKRSRFTLLDTLGDLGGLYDALNVVGLILVGVYKVVIGCELENYLLKMLFTRKLKKRIVDADCTEDEVMSSIKNQKRFSKESRNCIYCRSQKEKRVQRKGLQRINKELDIVRFIKLQKLVQNGFRSLFNDLEWFLVRN